LPVASTVAVVTTECSTASARSHHRVVSAKAATVTQTAHAMWSDGTAAYRFALAVSTV
jgi:hypothetical protein